MADTIGRAIGSVQSQLYADWELILVDNHSTDRSAEIIITYLRDPRIRLFQLENADRSQARNYGIENSTGDYICFLDADDTIHPGYLEEFARIFDRFPDCIAISDIHLIAKGRESVWAKSRLFNGNKLSYCVNHGTITFSAPAGYFATIRFEGDYGEDKQWLGRACEKADLAFTGKPYYNYFLVSKLYSAQDFVTTKAIEISSINDLYRNISSGYQATYPLEHALYDFLIKKAYVAIANQYFDEARKIIFTELKRPRSLHAALRKLKLIMTYLLKRYR